MICFLVDKLVHRLNLANSDFLKDLQVTVHKRFMYFHEAQHRECLLMMSHSFQRLTMQPIDLTFRINCICDFNCDICMFV
mmetsp:Transcript_44412/g.92904  ORF Transcript_44412/g.92904 Transcript_44412/m.92904 type:complete len:80 (+) Transcript_44412:130-369(+)